MSAHVFIAEDETSIVTLLKYNLEKEGHKVSFCENGEEALKQIKDKQPDLILMDWMLPDLSGVEICKNLKKDKKYNELLNIDGIGETQINSIKNFFEKFLAQIDQKLIEAKDLDRDQIRIDKANELILEIRELLSKNQFNDAKKVYSELKVVLKDIGISVRIT